ncbi:MAG: bifunctional phosphopantothenoylcysteine decarboxylase/phosphopantothenate--cysteine ligase CoaBC [Lactobacillaceae bacterium]|jgi:phosphopantothenoylcysteine decarboxylase/phosphopantothenate--cysteine ligase|nr:bifunctional phosphopantothenoylcysteine decarboxylase/phosphopantothenate--cysteine ligase CoaBC [Lactobacillaceae bacterium]
MFNSKKIVLIVTGGVAAYKSAIFARLLMKQGADVRVVMTQSATEFVQPKTFSTLTGNAVLTDLFADDNLSEVAHITLADWADYIFVVPATANIIAKMAQGIGDDAASTVLLARHTPTLVAPAMNEHMYYNPAMQRNLAQLQADGVLLIEPVTGLLAEGYAGKGRLPEPEAILAQAEMLLHQLTGQLTGKHFIVTAGGTREELDPVRYLSNHSSGKMGYALAQALLEQGAEVDLISTVTLPAPVGANVLAVTSAEQMLWALEDRFEAADGVVMAAAVADYRPAVIADQKIKKEAGQAMILKLVENPDVIASLAVNKTKQFIVAFAAETQDLLANAQVKLQKKHADMLIANDVTKTDAGFGTDTNVVTILQPGQANETLPVASKIDIARQIVGRITKALLEKEG